MDTVFDLIIVGLGSHGSSCFNHFSGKMNVLGIEQYESPHKRGSHNGDTRIVREMGYSGEYIEIARRSLILWNKLQTETSRQVYNNCGGLLFQDLSDNSNSNLQELKQSEIKDKYVFEPNKSQYYYLDKTAGYVRPEVAISIFLENGQKKGGKIINHCKYISHKYQNDQIIVYTDLGVFHSKKLIISLGIGIKRLANQYPLNVELQKQQLVFWKSDNQLFSKLPVFISKEKGLNIYGFPLINGEIKIAIDHYGPSLESPDLYDSTKNINGTVNQIRTFLSKHLPELKDAQVSRVETCVYTNTKDLNFTIDFDPQSKNTIILSACSGHGFKFCIVMGEIIEEMFNTGIQKYESFKMNRFQRARL